MIVYLDTSSLVKLYVDEYGSEKIREIVNTSRVIATSKIAYAEARAAFARKQREGGFSPKQLRKIVEELNRDWDSYFVLEITDGVIRTAGEVAEKHILRGFDAIHLASSIHLKNKTGSEIYFSSGDLKLNQIAEKEGMLVL